MTPVSQSSEESAGRKSILFCPVCGYESPLDDGWSVDARQEVDGQHTAVECPECGHVVVDQPDFRLLA
jgi:predicted RNA-binding Zn-ribbon protein involved in translation (DUF1610 family)